VTRTQAISNTKSPRLLKMSLLANAIFSALSGLSFVIFSKQAKAFLGWSNPWFIVAIGVGLLGFSMVVARAASTLNTETIKQIIFMDILWVLASAILLFTPWITTVAKWVVADLAVIVALFALLQSLGLQRAGAKNSFSVSTIIEASANDVWRVLADIGNIAQWHPGVKASHLISSEGGLGASRHCDLGGKNYLDEQVITWKPEQQLTMRITKTNLPMSANIHFHLTPTARGTKVEVKPVYQVNHGLLGLVLDTFYVRKNYKKGMQTLLSGLKQRVEARA
jgi:uncharacterized protein YndB with AHSA1/START domain